MRYLTFLFVTFLIPASLHALSVSEIIERANRAAYYKGDDGKAKVKMLITDNSGRERKREFVILRKDVDPGDTKNGDQKFYVYFERPADVYKTVFMVWKHVGGDDDRWLYLPALDLVKRISASDKRTSFVGSNFFYEDVSGRNPADDEHKLLEETDNFYVIESTPKDPASVEFSSFKTWIHKSSFLPIKTEYYDHNKKPYRRYEAKKVDTIDGFKTVTSALMEDLNGGGKTTMTYSSVQYNLNLPDSIFTERYLRNAPRKYLR